MHLEINPELLTPKPTRTDNTWKVWEKRNLKIHRGVIEWSPSDPFDSIDDLASNIREGVKGEYKVRWLRGFGFGVILHMKSVPDDFPKIVHHIDTRNKKDGVWQWAIILNEEHQLALGIHTWMHGYLRPVYDSVMTQLASAGYECISSDAEMDPLIAKLEKIRKRLGPIALLSGSSP